MKPICASHAAITTMDNSDIRHQPSSSSSGGGRAIDRHNPIIQQQKRLTTTTYPPPNNNNNNKLLLKNHKSNKQEEKRKAIKSIGFADENKDEQQHDDHEEEFVINKKTSVVRRRQGGGVLLGWGCTRPGDFISPANSSRFLLPPAPFSDQYFDPLLKPPPPPPPELDKMYNHDKSFRKDDHADLCSSSLKTTPRSSSSLSSHSSDQQVVVLRVSLHCRGCERKMRKHISKMEGVTSFNIDFMAKKVTVVGDITPLAVLTSVSKVKNAKLLTPTTISAPPAPQMDSNNFSEVKKQLGIVA